MKSLIMILGLAFSMNTFAARDQSKANCVIITKGFIKGYPLTLSIMKFKIQATDLLECDELAHEKLGLEYSGHLTLPGGISNPGGSANVTFRVKRVKYKFFKGKSKIIGRHKL